MPLTLHAQVCRFHDRLGRFGDGSAADEDEPRLFNIGLDAGKLLWRLRDCTCTGEHCKSFTVMSESGEVGCSRSTWTLQFADESQPGFPCRVSLEHAACGERLLLLNYVQQPAASPYHSSHAIYVAENSVATFDEVDGIPIPIRQRVLSIRAFSTNHMMVDADVIEGARAEELIDRLLANRDVH